MATDIMGVSGRAMLQSLIEGQRDPVVLADLAKRRLRSKTPELVEALTGRFSDHHAFLARMHLNLIDQHTQAIGELTERIEVVIEPFRGFHDLICSIPGISTLVAARSKDTYLGARYRRLSTRTGKSKAIVATEHTILVVIWNMAHAGALYDDPGVDYYTRLRPDRTKKRAIHQLEAMGYNVTLDRAG